MSQATAEAFAPAKVNLTLHVTGRRADGYHLLDSLVIFADVGDRIAVAASDAPFLRVTGPRAEGVPRDASNLVLQAAALAGHGPFTITLDKHLPAAAGIGGGSSDAAATLRAIATLTSSQVTDTLALGADLPVCLHGRPCRMSGIGEQIAEIPPLPPVHLVLVNPGVPVPTGAAFAGLDRCDNPPMPADLPVWPDAAGFAAWLARQRNDLEQSARRLAPEVGTVLTQIAATQGCLLARMSGSGATCFGLYASRQEAEDAARALSGAHPAWWVTAASPWRAPVPSSL
jgi:4-diphosphocytidyl-2-C-methyl-D-erythritol kinase